MPDKNCPLCKRVLKKLIGKEIYHPTGARVGISYASPRWYFRAFDLYHCPSCDEYFYQEAKESPIKAKPLPKRKE